MKRQRCTFIADEQALQLAYFERHFPDRVGQNDRRFQLKKKHRFDGLLAEARPAEALFDALKIQWHPFVGHGRSSQAACVNFLMPFASRPELLARWVGDSLGIAPPKMLPIEEEAAGDHRYVAFEYTGPDGRDWLGEAEGGRPQRGANATASDAAIAFEDESGKRQLLLIEWKYSEEYRNHRLSEDRRGKRIARYADKAFAPKGPVRSDLELTLTDFFHEPFYQLLRQQMLAWQIEEAGAFNRARVLHLSPAGNRALHGVTSPALRQVAGQCHQDAFEAYQATLVDPASFLQATIESSFAPLADWPEATWFPALAERYPTLCSGAR